MNIYDMFLENKNALQEKDILFFENTIEPDTSQYLLYTLASGHLITKLPTCFTAKSYPVFGILYVLNGTVIYYTQEHQPKTAVVSKNSLLLFDCRTSHILSCKEKSQFILIYFDGYPAKYYCDKLFPDISFVQTECSNDLYLKLQNILNFQTDNMQTHLVLTDFLTRLVKCITNKSVKPPKYILQIKELFDSAYYTNHTLEELEHEFQITRYRICRDFNQHFHISPIQYLHQVRIQNAQLLLQEGNMKIHEIAYEVGYENVNHFIHHFKKTAGITPAAYRKTLMTS